jgi:hypothetical protein
MGGYEFESSYHICNFIFRPSSSIVFILKSIPIVEINEALNASSENRNKIHVCEKINRIEIINHMFI